MTIEQENKENIFFKNIYDLPCDLINLIKEFVPKKSFVFTNKENYNLYHPLIKSDINNYENYIRDVVRRDHHFVFEKIVRENYKKWFKIKKYIYKYICYRDYTCFLINYCIEMDSSNCRKIFENFLKEVGLCKNLHKKNIIKYIRT